MYQIKWLWDRWRIMQHPNEEWYRIKQFIQYFYRDRKWAKKPPCQSAFRWRGTLDGRYSVEDLRDVVLHTFSDVHPFKLLNVIVPDIVAHDCWNYDAKNHLKGQQRFIHDINDFDYSQGEVKYMYELSRLYQFVPLVAYYIAGGDQEGILRLKTTLRQWYAQNPFLYNVAWKSGNVVGIRAVNLILFKSLLDLVDKDDEFDHFFANLMELHYKYLQSHLSLYSSKGNHHIGELAGMIAIAATFDFKHADKQLQKYVDELQSEVLRLIYDDGMNKEQAVRYQASYINLIMMSLMFANQRGIRQTVQVDNRMQAAYAFLAAMKIRYKTFFQIGDDDDAQLIYPYPDRTYNIYESMLNDYGILYGQMLDEDYHFDLRNYMLLGADGLRKYQVGVKRHFEPVKAARLYNESGYYVYSDDRLNLLFDVGCIGLLPTMSHGHSDMLHFQLYCDGIPVIVDPGAYQYNVKYRKLRDYFHGVHAHNTIAVEDRDQAVLSSGMFWLSNPEVHVEACSEQVTDAYCRAYHTGYVRKDMQVVHHRSMSVKQNTVTVVDELVGDSAHHCTYYLHFHPQVEVSLVDDQLVVEHKGRKLVSIACGLFRKGRLVRGDAETPLGWYSPSYDNIEATTTFVLACDLSTVNKIETIIRLL